MFLNDLTAMVTKFNMTNIWVESYCLICNITKDPEMGLKQEYLFQKGVHLERPNSDMIYSAKKRKITLIEKDMDSGPLTEHEYAKQYADKRQMGTHM